VIKLKNILAEGFAWERKADGSLPTLADTTAAYEAKMREQSAEQPLSNPMDDTIDEVSSRTHVVYSCNVELEDGTIKPGVRITVEKGADAEQKVREKIAARFKNSKIRAIGKAMNPSNNDNDADEPRWQDSDGDGKWYEPGEDVAEGLNELSDEEIDARWNTPQQRWQRQFKTSQMANDTKSSNMPNSSKSSEKAPSDFYREKLAALKAQRKQIEFDMEQEAEPEGGPIADYYGDALMHVDAQIDDIMSKMHKNESALITKGGLQEMRALPLEDRILRNLKGNDYILRETFKK